MQENLRISLLKNRMTRVVGLSFFMMFFLSVSCQKQETVDKTKQAAQAQEEFTTSRSSFVTTYGEQKDANGVVTVAGFSPDASAVSTITAEVVAANEATPLFNYAPPSGATATYSTEAIDFNSTKTPEEQCFDKTYDQLIPTYKDLPTSSGKFQYCIKLLRHKELQGTVYEENEAIFVRTPPVTLVASTGTGTGTTSSTNSSTVVAPSALTYSSPAVTYSAGSAINIAGPTSSGSVATYTVSPALPAGLTLNPSTGAITGTPTGAVSGTYTITATNSAGSTTYQLSITINPLAPTDLSYSTATATYTLGSAITANSPTSSGGAVASYSVSPALPAGLTLSTTTGVITGTPTAVSALASYTVTATNATGSTTKVLSITVNAVAPSSLSYSSNSVSYSVGTTITANTPTSSGGAVTSYSVSPALPAGLSLSTSTGVISGTPTGASAGASYTITASNSGGSTTKILSITVVAVVSGVSITIAGVLSCMPKTYS